MAESVIVRLIYGKFFTTNRNTNGLHHLPQKILGNTEETTEKLHAETLLLHPALLSQANSCNSYGPVSNFFKCSLAAKPIGPVGSSASARLKASRASENLLSFS